MFNIIAAIGKNRELGKNNQLVFHLKKDRIFFRTTTLGHSVVMGRKTFESIGRALPDRKNYVVTHSADGLSQDVIPICDVNAFIEQHLNSDEVFFVIGGASIYKLFLPDNTYFRCVFNTGFNFYSSSIMCCGLCNNYLNDLIMYNVISQGGHNKFNLIESYRISEADRSAINSILLLKKKNVTDSSSFYLLTAGNEQKLKVYV